MISPVRQVTPEQSLEINRYVEVLKERGEKVFNPIEDAPQDDATGYNIVMAELNFMHKAAKNGGRVDILWNKGGKPSEGSRVDFGIAYALGLETSLAVVFNENSPTGPQEAFGIIKDLANGRSSLRLKLLDALLENIRKAKKVVIDWDIDMSTERQEWQRIRLGLALGCMAQNPKLRIKMGRLSGDEMPGKGYPKVIREIEKRQSRT